MVYAGVCCCHCPGLFYCSVVLLGFFLIILFVSFNCNLPTNGYKTHFASFKSLAVFSTNSSMCVTLFALYKKWMTITQLFPFSFTHFLVLQRQVYSQGFFLFFSFIRPALLKKKKRKLSLLLKQGSLICFQVEITTYHSIYILVNA